jgi:hypothetical protein
MEQHRSRTQARCEHCPRRDLWKRLPALSQSLPSILLPFSSPTPVPLCKRPAPRLLEPPLPVYVKTRVTKKKPHGVLSAPVPFPSTGTMRSVTYTIFSRVPMWNRAQHLLHGTLLDTTSLFGSPPPPWLTPPLHIDFPWDTS